MHIPQTTTQRLLAVADIIEQQPGRFDMENWVASGDEDQVVPTRPVLLAGLANDLDCGTTCCVAGWAIALTPRHQVLVEDWTTAGARSLGLSYMFAATLFMAIYVEHSDLANCLRALARMSEKDRRQLQHEEAVALLYNETVEGP